jgi:hypothetical protein
MKLHLVPARVGVLWVRSGLRVFGRQPLAFISLFLFFMTAVSIASQLPVVGAVIAPMLLPSMTLGIMAGTAQAASPEKPTMRTIFQAALHAVRADARSMAVLGVMYTVLFLAVVAASALADGGVLARAYLLGGTLTREMAESTGFQIAMWIVMGLSLPLSLVFWHAPALVHWHRVPPAKSLFFSLVACYRNFGALTLYSLVWAGIFIAANIALGLLAMLLIGVATGAPEVVFAVMLGGTLVMVAMFFTSTWFTFRDSFLAE